MCVLSQHHHPFMLISRGHVGQGEVASWFTADGGDRHLGAQFGLRRKIRHKTKDCKWQLIQRLATRPDGCFCCPFQSHLHEPAKRQTQCTPRDDRADQQPQTWSVVIFSNVKQLDYIVSPPLPPPCLPQPIKMECPLFVLLRIPTGMGSKP